MLLSGRTGTQIHGVPNERWLFFEPQIFLTMDDAKKQEVYQKLWDKHQDKAVTDDEGTYVNLENFNLADHDLSMEDTRVPGNQTLSSTKNQKRGFSLRQSGGGFRLFKGM